MVTWPQIQFFPVSNWTALVSNPRMTRTLNKIRLQRIRLNRQVLLSKVLSPIRISGMAGAVSGQAANVIYGGDGALVQTGTRNAKNADTKPRFETTDYVSILLTNIFICYRAATSADGQIRFYGSV